MGPGGRGYCNSPPGQFDEPAGVRSVKRVRGQQVGSPGQFGELAGVRGLHGRGNSAHLRDFLN